MIVPALVLTLAALVVGGAGVLALVHRLPRNRVLGVRTLWTMGSVDAFRRANRAAAPAFVGAGLVGLAGAGAALLSATTVAGVTMLVLGALGLVGLLGAGGIVGARFAAAEEAEHEALAALPPDLVHAARGAGLRAGRRGVRRLVRDLPARSDPGLTHQPQVPGLPLKGPTTSAVIQPP